MTCVLRAFSIGASRPRNRAHLRLGNPREMEWEVVRRSFFMVRWYFDCFSDKIICLEWEKVSWIVSFCAKLLTKLVWMIQSLYIWIGHKYALLGIGFGFFRWFDQIFSMDSDYKLIIYMVCNIGKCIWFWDIYIKKFRPLTDLNRIMDIIKLERKT